MFEDDRLQGFGPLVALRHAGALGWGTKTLLAAIEEAVGREGQAGLWGRDLVSESSKESLGREYNLDPGETSFFVNARARPDKSLRELASRPAAFVALSEGQLVAARLPGRSLSPGPVKAKDALAVGKKVERLDLPPGCMFRGYWDLVESNGLAVAEQAGHFADSQAPSESVEVLGPPSNLRIEGTAEVGKFVTFDVRPGPVVVDKGAVVESFSRVTGPTYIGANSRVHSAFVGGGSSVFEGCVLGGQLEATVMMPHSNKAHGGYLGHSYVGEWVNLGAGSNFSDLKNTYGNVRVELEGRTEDSGLVKLGSAVGDMCKVSIGALVYAGKSVGTGAQVSGLATRSVPSFTFFDGFAGAQVEIRIDSVLETQRRMMERRGKTPTRAEELLIRKVFAASSGERQRAGVRRGDIGSRPAKGARRRLP